MKVRYRFFWLLFAFCLTFSDSQAGIVLNPVAGISRTTIYGSDGGGPPGIIGYDYSANLNGPILGNVDPRYMQGYDMDSLLLYDLRGFSSGGVSGAKLAMNVDQALNNFDPDFPSTVYLYVSIFGGNGATLSPGDFGGTPVFSTVLGIPSGEYGGAYLLSPDITNTVRGLLDGGFNHAKVLFQTFAETTTGPSLVTFARPVTLNITANIQPVPEASSIIQVAISLAGALLHRRFATARS